MNVTMHITKVIDWNKSLKDKNFEIEKENTNLKSALVNLKNLVKKKQEKIQEITVDLEGIKKNLRMLNSTTTKLDQILNMKQSMSNQNGLGYTAIAEPVATTFKTVFVKTTPQQQITMFLVRMQNHHHLKIR